MKFKKVITRDKGYRVKQCCVHIAYSIEETMKHLTTHYHCTICFIKSYSIIRQRTTQHHTTPHSKAPHHTTQHSTTPHSTTTENNTQHSTKPHHITQYSTPPHHTTTHGTALHLRFSLSLRSISQFLNDLMGYHTERQARPQSVAHLSQHK